MSTRKAYILVVDDDPIDQKMTQMMFKKSKILNELNFMKDGEDALDFIFKQNGYEDAPTPDIIFLDMYMPKMTGIEILEKIQNHPIIDTATIIMLTSSESSHHIDLAAEFGAHGYVTKPLDAHKIMETVLYNNTIRLELVVEE